MSSPETATCIHSAEGYNEFYAERPNVFGLEPDPFVLKAAELLQTAKVLDIGAGQGRNSLPLAERGFDVLALDTADEGLAQLRQAHLAIRTQVLDAIHDELPGSFDLMVNSLLLHHFTRADALQLVRSMQAHTSPGGLNVIRAFTQAKSDYAQRDADIDRFYLSEGELTQLYHGWEIIAYQEVPLQAVRKRSDGSFYMNQVADIIARKPIS